MVNLSRIARLPGGVLTRILWQFGLTRPPDRALLEDVILTRYRDCAAFPRVLLVGVAQYSHHYPALFAGQEVVSIDCDPSSARYGATRHIIDRIENLGNYVSPQFFDVILMNGLVGYGLDDLQSTRAAVTVCHHHLRDGGELLLSTDEGRPLHGRLSELAELQRGFVEFDCPLLGPRVVCEVPWRLQSQHVFCFFRKREGTTENGS